MNAIQKEIHSILQFINETDKLKTVLRQTLVHDRSRQENSAEHSWHLALMAVLLRPYANEPELDLLRALKMLLIHDIVEIDAGDTFAYDTAGHADKEEREKQAAERLFGMLPDNMKMEMHALWREFEDRETPEARFASALDRMHPMLLNYYTEGASWQKHGITSDRVVARNGKMIKEGSEDLWTYAEFMIRDAVEKGILLK